jgi:uncharacterized short protein YbdD (DUF466 family)
MSDTSASSQPAPPRAVPGGADGESLLTRVPALLRRIIGAPDYAAYCRHVEQRHPGAMPATEAEFLEERLQARYSRPGNRCC